MFLSYGRGLKMRFDIDACGVRIRLRCKMTEFFKIKRPCAGIPTLIYTRACRGIGEAYSRYTEGRMPHGVPATLLTNYFIFAYETRRRELLRQVKGAVPLQPLAPMLLAPMGS